MIPCAYGAANGIEPTASQSTPIGRVRSAEIQEFRRARRQPAFRRVHQLSFTHDSQEGLNRADDGHLHPDVVSHVLAIESLHCCLFCCRANAVALGTLGFRVRGLGTCGNNGRRNTLG